MHYADYMYYVCYVHYLDILLCRFASDLVSQITCGRRSALLSPRQLMHWAISFVQPCVLVGCRTFGPPILMGLQPCHKLLERELWSCLTMSDDALLLLLSRRLLSAMNTDPKHSLEFEIMSIIAKIISIIVE